MALNGSDAYLPVHNNSPFFSVFGGTQSGKCRFIKRADAVPSQDNIDWYVDIFPIIIRNVRTNKKIKEAALKHSTKFPCPEIMIEVYEPSEPLSELRHWPYHILHPIALVNARNVVAFANGTIVMEEDANHRFRS